MTHPKALTAIQNLGLSIDEYKNFLTELESSVRASIDEIKKHILQKKSNQAADTMHSIKGSVGSLGFTNSYGQCQKLEAEFKKGLPENSIGLLEEFIKIFFDELTEIKQTL